MQFLRTKVFKTFLKEKKIVVMRKSFRIVPTKNSNQVQSIKSFTGKITALKRKRVKSGK